VDLSSLAVPELLTLHSRIAEELRARGITRSANSPAGDLAEYLFCKAFGWNQATNSVAHIDAIGQDGCRYQIKARRMTRHNKSRQLSALRNLDGGHFDFLAGILFAEDYRVFRAAIIPHAVVLARASFVERTNSHRFLLHDDVWDAPGVRDVTTEMRANII
jgi:hypothetical protein